MINGRSQGGKDPIKEARCAIYGRRLRFLLPWYIFARRTTSRSECVPRVGRQCDTFRAFCAQVPPIHIWSRGKRHIICTPGRFLGNKSFSRLTYRHAVAHHKRRRACASSHKANCRNVDFFSDCVTAYCVTVICLAQGLVKNT